MLENAFSKGCKERLKVQLRELSPIRLEKIPEIVYSYMFVVSRDQVETLHQSIPKCCFISDSTYMWPTTNLQTPFRDLSSYTPQQPHHLQPPRAPLTRRWLIPELERETRFRHVIHNDVQTFWDLLSEYEREKIVKRQNLPLNNMLRAHSVYVQYAWKFLFTVGWNPRILCEESFFERNARCRSIIRWALRMRQYLKPSTMHAGFSVKINDENKKFHLFPTFRIEFWVLWALRFSIILMFEQTGESRVNATAASAFHSGIS